MFARSLTERVVQQRKTTANGPMGQSETWSVVREFWASVTELSADQVSSWVGQRGQEGTQRIYVVLARALDRDWSFGDTRFSWDASDADGPRILKPIKNMLQPGRQYRQWSKIACQDVTDFSSSC